MRESLNGGKGTFIPASQPELKLCFPISLNPGSPRRQNLLSFIDFIFSASSPAGKETKRAVLRIEILQHKAAVPEEFHHKEVVWVALLKKQSLRKREECTNRDDLQKIKKRKQTSVHILPR